MTSPASPAFPSRRTSKILVRHVGSEFLLPLCCCLGSFMLLFMVIDLFDALSDFVGAKASVPDVVQFFLLRQPANLVNILPMSILLACGYMVSNFTRNHEVTAMRASGISMVNAFVPVWLVAGVCTMVSFLFVELVAPASSARADAIYKKITDPSSTPDARGMLASRNVRGNRDWNVENFSIDGVQRGVKILQFRANRWPAWRIQAESATYVSGHWRLEKGTKTEYDADGLPKDEGLDFAVLDCPELTESPHEILGSLRPAEELSIREMLQLLSRKEGVARTSQNVFWTQIWYRVSAPFSCLGAALLGIALSLGSHRGSRLRGFSIALGVLVLYYLVGQMLVMLGKSGAIPPIMAGMLPTLLLAAWGIAEMRRRN